MGGALFFIQTVKPTYQSAALININKEEEKNKNIINITTEDKSKEETLENEMMLITSNEFLLHVIENLKLNISYFEKGYIQNRIVDEEPFIIRPTVPVDKLPQAIYEITITKEGFTVVHTVTKKSVLISGHFSAKVIAGLPFTIIIKSKASLAGLMNKEYQVNLDPTESVLKDLKKSLVLKVDEKAKGSLQLFHSGKNPMRSREILTEVIRLLDERIVSNKQKLFTSTVSFLNQRIAEFTREKDSIESVKEQYLQRNDVLVLENYIVDKTTKKTVKKEDYLKNEMQIYLTKFALKEINNTPDNSFLGTNYNLEESTVNQLLAKYNETLLASELLLQRAQKNNPAYSSLLIQLKAQKKAIIKNLEGNLVFLSKEKETTVAEKDVAIKEANTIPTKDKILGNINGDLSMKQEIYIILLQKREEAILNGAVIESNMKILNTPDTNYSPTFPQKRPFLLGAFLLGLLIPFGLIYLFL